MNDGSIIETLENIYGDLSEIVDKQRDLEADTYSLYKIIYDREGDREESELSALADKIHIDSTNNCGRSIDLLVYVARLIHDLEQPSDRLADRDDVDAQSPPGTERHTARRMRIRAQRRGVGFLAGPKGLPIQIQAFDGLATAHPQSRTQNEPSRSRVCRG